MSGPSSDCDRWEGALDSARPALAVQAYPSGPRSEDHTDVGGLIHHTSGLDRERLPQASPIVVASSTRPKPHRSTRMVVESDDRCGSQGTRRAVGTTPTAATLLCKRPLQRAIRVTESARLQHRAVHADTGSIGPPRCRVHSNPTEESLPLRESWCFGDAQLCSEKWPQPIGNAGLRWAVRS